MPIEVIKWMLKRTMFTLLHKFAIFYIDFQHSKVKMLCHNVL